MRIIDFLFKKSKPIKNSSPKNKGASATESFLFPTPEIIKVPTIPEKFNRTYKARSRSEPEKIYEVNVKHLSCTCKGFLQYRASYENNDVRRVCPHIYDKLYQTKVEQTFPHILRLVIRYGRNDKNFKTLEDNDGEFLFGYSPNSFWVRIFANVGGVTSVGLYNLKENRWGYEDIPKHSALLIDKVLMVFQKHC